MIPVFNTKLSGEFLDYQNNFTCITDTGFVYNYLPTPFKEHLEIAASLSKTSINIFYCRLVLGCIYALQKCTIMIYIRVKKVQLSLCL